MIATLAVAALLSAPGAPPGASPAVAHDGAEPALLRAAYPDYDEASGRLGHGEGTLVGRSSACLEDGPCVLAVAAGDALPGGPPGGHAWTTFFAFRRVDGAWEEAGSTAGPVISAAGPWRLGVAVRAGDDGAFVTVTTASRGGDDGDVTATHLWSWEGKRFLPVFSASSGLQGSTETEASYTACQDRPADRPSWELRTREREGRGPWTETRTRVLWNGQAWVERPAERPCVRGAAVTATPAGAAVSGAATGTASPPGTVPLKAATASRTAPAPKGRPRANAPANAIDGDRQTAWVAGGKKGGVGEWLQVELASPTALAALQVVGTCPGADWKAGPRLKKVRLRFESGPPQEETLADVQGPQVIRVSRKAPARWVRLELLDLYRGARHQDACVAEVVAQRR